MDGTESPFELVAQPSTLLTDDAANDASAHASFWPRWTNDGSTYFRSLGRQPDTHRTICPTDIPYLERRWWSYDICNNPVKYERL